MPNLQTQFIKFHEAIQLEDLDENKTLREKRDLLLEKLRDGLKKRFNGQKVPSFEHRNQGSYSIGTGIKPSNGRDFDIDVALLFNIDPEAIDAVDVKQWVFEILNVHPHSAVIRRPCVTVNYMQAGETAYHVDFPIYASPGAGRDVPLLARGFPGSPSNSEWVRSDFQGLLSALNGKFTDTDDRLQYRRAIRYLKRWKDTLFPARGEGAPKGIGLTCAAYLWFQPAWTFDPLSKQRSYDDFVALKALVGSMRSAFQYTVTGYRLKTPLPAEPWGDPFERMSDKQMAAFRTKLDALYEALVTASGRVDPEQACRDLQPFFGEDFPIPDKKTTAVATIGPALVSTGHYA